MPHIEHGFGAPRPEASHSSLPPSEPAGERPKLKNAYELLEELDLPPDTLPDPTPPPTE
jgi:hypothetical protein